MATKDPRPPLASWFEDFDAEHLRALLTEASFRVPGLGEWLELQRAAYSDDPEELLAVVNQRLSPRRRFYDYRQANEYADECEETVELLAERAAHATPTLIPVIERAITLTTRAILKSDDSSGLQGDQVRRLLYAHARATRMCNPPLTQKEQSRLVNWIVKYRYGGTQDFFDPDIVGYAPGLSETSIQRYRDAIAATDLGNYGRYPLTRLAVLDKDRDAIVATNGGEPKNSLVAARLVSDLEEAGLHEDAVVYAKLGMQLDDRGWDASFATFLVEDAFARDDRKQAVAVRREWFTRFPHSHSFSSFRETAERAELWPGEREAAEALLAERDPAGFISHLLTAGQDDQAWEFAMERIETLGASAPWLDLCKRRALTAPADTLPIYRRLVTDTLIETDKRNYRSAANILKTMRDVAMSAGTEATAEFQVFLAQTVDDNRRRPTCLEAFARAGLISKR